MRKLPTVAGLVLIFVGLLLASIYNSSVTKELWRTETENTDKWSISANFSSGDNMTLVIAWTTIAGGEDLGELPANVTIKADNQDTTEFQVFFRQSSDIPAGQEEVQVYVARIQLLSNNGDSLSVDDPPMQIGGVVRQAGTFEALVHPPPEWFPWAGYPEAKPPRALQLLKLIVTRTYPYRDLLPVGAATGVLGAIMSSWGATAATKNQVRIRKRKKNR